jgi:hypothetical protein
MVVEAAPSRTSVGIDVAALASVLAWVLFGFGAVAGPLTPSEGHPRIVDLAIFLVAPAVLFAWLFIRGTSRTVRVAGLGQLCALAWFGWLVLSVVFRT